MAESNAASDATEIPRCAPLDRVVGYQQWRHLLFLHWRLPPDVVQPLLPAPLEVETFDGDAWIGLVLFTMRGVRPRWFPAVPWISAFHETNVRTYVRHPGAPQGDDSGVWFFSLDAALPPAVLVARWKWHLPYFRSHMSLTRTDSSVSYSSRRLWPKPAGATVEINASVEEPLPPAAPGSLDRFLVERYTLFSAENRGTLYSARVEHVPYPLRAAEIGECDESLIAAAGLNVSGPPVHGVFSDGVDVRIGRLTRVG